MRIEQPLTQFSRLKYYPDVVLYRLDENHKDTLVACHVCRKQWTYLVYVHRKNTYVLDDTVYIVPYFHESCRELFELNPLAYGQP